MNRHDSDAVSLAFGLVFLAFVGWWLLVRSVTVQAPGPGWFVAAALLVLGGLGVFTTLSSLRGRKATDRAPDPTSRP